MNKQISRILVDAVLTGQFASLFLCRVRQPIQNQEDYSVVSILRKHGMQVLSEMSLGGETRY
jgi:hypothetical protein